MARSTRFSAVRLPTKATIGRSGSPRRVRAARRSSSSGGRKCAGVAGVRDDHRPVVSDDGTDRCSDSAAAGHSATTRTARRTCSSGDPPVEVVADPAPRIADAPVHERAPGEPEGDRAGRQGGGAVRDHEVDAPRRPAEGEERRGSERTPAQRRDRQLAFPSARAQCGHGGGEAACPELRGQLGCLDLRSAAVVGRCDDEHRRALPRPQPLATAPSWSHDEQSPVPPEEEGVLPPRGACPGDDGTQAEVADPQRGSMARVGLRSGRRPLPGERSVGPTIRHPLAQQLAGGARESVVDAGPPRRSAAPARPCGPASRDRRPHRRRGATRRSHRGR